MYFLSESIVEKEAKVWEAGDRNVESHAEIAARRGDWPELDRNRCHNGPTKTVEDTTPGVLPIAAPLTGAVGGTPAIGTLISVG